VRFIFLLVSESIDIHKKQRALDNLYEVRKSKKLGEWKKIEEQVGDNEEDKVKLQIEKLVKEKNNEKEENTLKRAGGKLILK
jgi:hypothetical protein